MARGGGPGLMNMVDRLVRAAVFRLFVAGLDRPTVGDVALELGIGADTVAESFRRLASAHRLVLGGDGQNVAMAHPFSGVPTDYESSIGDRTWSANCGWDAFAILALLGDGEVAAQTDDGDTARWTVEDGTVTPDGFVHFVVPPSRFWDDIAFT